MQVLEAPPRSSTDQDRYQTPTELADDLII